MQAIVQNDGRSGAIQVMARAPGLRDATIRLMALPNLQSS
jgi:hypothetical protein